MTEDVKVLTAWILVCVIIAAIGTTAVPILYSFFPWRTRPIGKLFMLQSISFAAAMDFTVILSLWAPKNIVLIFWINALVFTFVAVSNMSMAVWLLTKMCIYPRKGTHNAPEQ